MDCVVLDLEDGVAINQKQTARELVVKSFQTLNFGRAEKSIRMNAIGSGLENKDLEECIKPLAKSGKLDSIVVIFKILDHFL